MFFFFFHQWFVGSTHVEFVFMQHILMYLFFSFQIPKPYAIITTLIFFFESQETDDVQLINIKKALTSLGVTSPKGQNFSKDRALCNFIGEGTF